MLGPPPLGLITEALIPFPLGLFRPPQGPPSYIEFILYIVYRIYRVSYIEEVGSLAVILLHVLHHLIHALYRHHHSA